MSPESKRRQRDLDTFLQSGGPRQWLDRARVLDECDSTQDEAFKAAAGTPGVLVTTIQQHKGRGRLGRTWNQGADRGLAVTFVLDAASHDPSMLPLRSACAVCRACEAIVGQLADEGATPQFRIKWPNDVVVSKEPRGRHAPYRKLSGILIERRDNLLLLGIGVNVRQTEADWPEDLRHRSVSLAQLMDATPPHDGLLHSLIEGLDHFLYAGQHEVRQDFRKRDVLIGSRQTFASGTDRITGVIDSIDPDEGICLYLDDGTRTVLPAATSTLVH